MHSGNGLVFDWRDLGRETTKWVESFPSYMKSKYRLKSRLDFQAVYAKGRSVANRVAVVYILSQQAGSPTRIGFAAGKKLGKAVVRNRVKRRMKEAVRLVWSRVKPGVLFIVIARQGALSVSFAQLQLKIEQLFEQAGLLRKEGQLP